MRIRSNHIQSCPGDIDMSTCKNRTCHIGSAGIRRVIDEVFQGNTVCRKRRSSIINNFYFTEIIGIDGQAFKF